MSRKSELFDRATDCERQMRQAVDPKKQTAFRVLRNMWIVLANESMTMPTDRLAEEILAIEKIQAIAERGPLQEQIRLPVPPSRSRHGSTGLAEASEPGGFATRASSVARFD
jgi:hypothetical protein